MVMGKYSKKKVKQKEKYFNGILLIRGLLCAMG